MPTPSVLEMLSSNERWPHIVHYLGCNLPIHVPPNRFFLGHRPGRAGPLGMRVDRARNNAMTRSHSEWTPTPENINALPAPLRRYIHHLETAHDS